MNLLRQNAASKTLHVQVLNENQSELIHQHASQLVLMIQTLVKDVLVNLAQDYNRFATSMRPFLASSNTTLSTTILLRLSVPARILHLRAVRQ